MKTKEKKDKVFDLFLLMVALNHFNSKEKVLDFFMDAINELWPEIKMSYRPKHSGSDDNLFEVAYNASNYGYLKIGCVDRLKKEDHDLLFNAVAMLGSVLNKIEQDKLLNNEKLLLQKLVDEKVKKITEREEKFRNVFENSITGKSLTTPGGQMKFNRSFCKILGYSKHELSRLKWYEITHPEDIERDREIVNSMISGKNKSARWEKRYIHKDGSVIWVDINTILQRNDKGKPLYFITSIIDITELKKANEEISQINSSLEQRIAERTSELMELNKELEAFSYSVSHDLRAPLRHINGFASMLNESLKVKVSGKSKEYLDHITDSTHQMGRLIDDLLQFSRTGRLEIYISEVNMNEPVRDALKTLQDDCAGRNIKWTVADLPQVVGDYNLLLLVWINLIGNAIKFTRMKKQAIIEIGYRQEKGEFQFFIHDNGAGFEMQYVHKLFGVFQRLHSADQFEGTGIGLANVHRIIRKHGGHTWAEGIPGKGATFYFTLKNPKSP